MVKDSDKKCKGNPAQVKNLGDCALLLLYSLFHLTKAPFQPIFIAVPAELGKNDPLQGRITQHTGRSHHEQYIQPEHDSEAVQ
jgi:hypothetical protein